ncbi:hypothetical protein [Agaribacterium haliotis]|uniref:hypothetical protein n=1 Tax=Agaribacterium haliotis TaxID=2013869 RepID=UPI000BB55593|nr:hypothetical protein [Agaribacterium haliotis]
MAIKKQKESYSISIPLARQIRELSDYSGIPASRLVEAGLRNFMSKELTLETIRDALNAPLPTGAALTDNKA